MKTVTLLCLLVAVVAVRADYDDSRSGYDRPTSYVKAAGTPVRSGNSGYVSLYSRGGSGDYSSRYYDGYKSSYRGYYGGSDYTSRYYDSYKPSYRGYYGRQSYYGDDDRYDDSYGGYRYNTGRYRRYSFDDDHYDDDRYDDDRYDDDHREH